MTSLLLFLVLSVDGLKSLFLLLSNHLRNNDRVMRARLHIHHGVEVSGHCIWVHWLKHLVCALLIGVLVLLIIELPVFTFIAPLVLAFIVVVL
jgi:hypothetical protein